MDGFDFLSYFLVYIYGYYILASPRLLWVVVHAFLFRVIFTLVYYDDI